MNTKVCDYCLGNRWTDYDEDGKTRDCEVCHGLGVVEDPLDPETVATTFAPLDQLTTKPSNPKDGFGVRKWRQFATIPLSVLAGVGAAMLEGAFKYGRSNYRVAGVRASVYVDAAMGHILQWWEGEDIDADSGLSHVDKAIASLVVLRDAMIQDMLNDDRPPKSNLDKVRTEIQAAVDAMFEKYPTPVQPYTEVGERTNG